MKIVDAPGVRRGRLSFPFFFDPAFDAEVPPLPGAARMLPSGRPRWDGANLQAFTGTYGDYLLGKVAKVFRSYAARSSDRPG